MDQNKRGRSQSEGDCSKVSRRLMPKRAQGDEHEEGVCSSPVVEGFVASMELQIPKYKPAETPSVSLASRASMIVDRVLTVDREAGSPPKPAAECRPANASPGFKVTVGFSPKPDSEKPKLSRESPCEFDLASKCKARH